MAADNNHQDAKKQLVNLKQKGYNSMKDEKANIYRRLLYPD
jgi:hypothetical protein